MNIKRILYALPVLLMLWSCAPVWVFAEAGGTEGGLAGEATEPVETTEPVGTTEPVETAEPVESAKPVETDKPAETAEPAETTKPIETTEPAESAKPIETPEALLGERNIYIGDIITFKVTTRDFSAGELREKFQGFEIVEIKDEPDGYLLSLRTFETGEHKILLGDKEIIIDVHSTLVDIQRDGIFEGDAGVIEPGFPFYWRVLFYAAAGVFVLSGGLALYMFIRKKRFKTISPYRLFLSRADSLSVGDDNYFVDLTFYFKEYIESLFNRRIIGKTSAEIVSELKDIRELADILPEIEKWLTECDEMKFTGVKVSEEKKRSHCGELLRVADKIDKNEETA